MAEYLKIFFFLFLIQSWNVLLAAPPMPHIICGLEKKPGSYRSSDYLYLTSSIHDGQNTTRYCCVCPDGLKPLSDCNGTNIQPVCPENPIIENATDIEDLPTMANTPTNDDSEIFIYLGVFFAIFAVLVVGIYYLKKYISVIRAGWCNISGGQNRSKKIVYHPAEDGDGLLVGADGNHGNDPAGDGAGGNHGNHGNHPAGDGAGANDGANDGNHGVDGSVTGNHGSNTGRDSFGNSSCTNLDLEEDTGADHSRGTAGLSQRTFEDLSTGTEGEKRPPKVDEGEEVYEGEALGDAVVEDKAIGFDVERNAPYFPAQHPTGTGRLDEETQPLLRGNLAERGAGEPPLVEGGAGEPPLDIVTINIMTPADVHINVRQSTS